MAGGARGGRVPRKFPEDRVSACKLAFEWAPHTSMVDGSKERLHSEQESTSKPTCSGNRRGAITPKHGISHCPCSPVLSPSTIPQYYCFTAWHLALSLFALPVLQQRLYSKAVKNELSILLATFFLQTHSFSIAGLISPLLEACTGDRSCPPKHAKNVLPRTIFHQLFFLDSNINLPE
eukprot:1130658-Pelagomonas_calceolata.AAC.1